ncbi:MAG TPA: AAA family ATPase [Steroidobacteraceae bacterium]|nr:AAA family ATPase [Steroidobacteraceae bacterium]
MSAVPGNARLLLLTGAPATGKTRLAMALAQRYGACGCSKDEIKELLFDVLGTGTAEYSRRLSDASFALLFALLPRLLRPGHLLLLEGNFRRAEHEAPLARALGPQAAALAQVWCRAQAGTRAARLMARAADPGRHPGHHDATADLAAASAEGFLELPGPRWEFDSDQPWEQAFHALCTGLDSWCAPSGGANA